jgi:hypothetical protein
MKKTCRVLLLILCASIADGTIWYVHPDSTIAYVQEGLDSCSMGDTVLVGPGTYYENIFWPAVQGIYLVSHHGSDTTILDGAGMGRILCIDVNIDTSTHIHGFTFQYGYSEIGGAIYCEGSSPFISSCHFHNNEAHGSTGGGAIACLDHADPIIARCNIHDNSSSTYRGGGILCYNYASPIVHACNITHNTGDPGAGISIAYGCYPIIDSCTIADNYGDGVQVGGGDAQIHYCNITDNAGYGVRNNDPNFDIEAQYNWWGHASGPGGVGPGSGDEVSSWVSYIPWLTSPVTSVSEKHSVPIKSVGFRPTIQRNPVQLPEGRKAMLFDVSGRKIDSRYAGPGIYFVEVDEADVHKIIIVE